MGVIENIEGNGIRTIALRREHNIHTISNHVTTINQLNDLNVTRYYIILVGTCLYSLGQIYLNLFILTCLNPFSSVFLIHGK
jgi:hypothetical protein